jgi:hypothetical protein
MELVVCCVCSFLLYSCLFVFSFVFVSFCRYGSRGLIQNEINKIKIFFG